MDIEQLFSTADAAKIAEAIRARLDSSGHQGYLASKALPFSEAILSVLLPLRDMDLLFDPEGRYASRLDSTLFLRWCDLVSLKLLLFTLAHSNEAGRLVRTKLSKQQVKNYKPVALKSLARYLNSYGVDLEDEMRDFPVASYNLHQGVSDILRQILKE